MMVHRARPLLGTLVEIRADAEPALAHRAATSAFEAISVLHRLMSAHDPESDVGRLNRFAHSRAMLVSRHTWRVLDAARRVSAASGGAFDICVAPQLARWGYLPKWMGRGRDGRACWKDIELLPDDHVRFRKNASIDLGGIAKGYAVERAAAILIEHGVTRFTVNAGGDMRVGDALQTIHLRDPARPARLLPLAQVSRAAVATSAGYFAAKKRRGKNIHPIVVPRSGQCAPVHGSITVLAAECTLADALTKVVAVLGERSAAVLARFGAEALLLSEGGSLRRMAEPAVAA